MQHANQFGHSIDFDQATIVDKARDYHKRLFLEAWHALGDGNATNEPIDVPGIYSSLLRSDGSLRVMIVARANCEPLDKRLLIFLINVLFFNVFYESESYTF